MYAGDWADYIANSRPEVAERYFTVVETADEQVALVCLDGRLSRVIGPSSRVLFWKGAVTVTFERIDVRANPEVPASLLPALARLGRESAATSRRWTKASAVSCTSTGAVRELGHGNYGFWNAVSTPRIEVLEVRRQTVEVAGQEILTSDKVTLRVNISAVYEIVNVTSARAGVKDVADTCTVRCRSPCASRSESARWSRRSRRRPTSTKRCRPRCGGRWRLMVCA